MARCDLLLLCVCTHCIWCKRCNDDWIILTFLFTFRSGSGFGSLFVGYILFFYILSIIIFHVENVFRLNIGLLYCMHFHFLDLFLFFTLYNFIYFRYCVCVCAVCNGTGTICFRTGNFFRAQTPNAQWIYNVIQRRRSDIRRAMNNKPAFIWAIKMQRRCRSRIQHTHTHTPHKNLYEKNGRIPEMRNRRPKENQQK